MSVLAEDPAITDILELRNSLRRRDRSCATLVDDTLAAINADPDRRTIFTHVADEQARETARAQDEENRRYSDTVPLCGIPMAVKEIIAVAGQPTSAGSTIEIADLCPDEGPVVRRLRDAGAIPIGKTCSTEFALSYHNLSRPLPPNPAYPGEIRTAGGSSTGAAVAVAKGLCSFAVGSDTGGSIRVPAAFCGVTGFKPSVEFWSRDGMLPLSRDIDTIGLLTADAKGLAYVLKSIGAAVIEPVDATALHLGICKSPFFEDLSPEVSERFGKAIQTLSTKVKRISTISLPNFDSLQSFAQVVNSAALVRYLGRERVEANFHLADPVTQLRFRAGLDADINEIQTLVQTRRTLANRIGSNLAHIDALITPTTPNQPECVANLSSADSIAAWQSKTARFVRFANLFNMPAITIPLRGPTPVGLQLIGAPGKEGHLVSVAQTLQVLLDNAG